MRPAMRIQSCLFAAALAAFLGACGESRDPAATNAGAVAADKVEALSMTEQTEAERAAIAQMAEPEYFRKKTMPAAEEFMNTFDSMWAKHWTQPWEAAQKGGNGADEESLLPHLNAAHTFYTLLAESDVGFPAERLSKENALRMKTAFEDGRQASAIVRDVLADAIELVENGAMNKREMDSLIERYNAIQDPIVDFMENLQAVQSDVKVPDAAAGGKPKAVNFH